MICKISPFLCCTRYSTPTLSPTSLSSWIASSNIGLSSSITEGAIIWNPLASSSSFDSYPKILRAARFILMISFPSSVWSITPHSIEVKIFSNDWFFRMISCSYSRSFVTSIATPTVPITLPSTLYNGDLYVVSWRMPSPVLIVSSDTYVFSFDITSRSDSIQAGSSSSTSQI